LFTEPSYYTKQLIEQIFGFAKSSNNLLPIRVHSALQGYLFLNFIVLILFIKVRGQLKEEPSPQHALIIFKKPKGKNF
jgi:hypothetical protein